MCVYMLKWRHCLSRDISSYFSFVGPPPHQHPSRRERQVFTPVWCGSDTGTLFVPGLSSVASRLPSSQHVQKKKLKKVKFYFFFSFLFWGILALQFPQSWICVLITRSASHSQSLNIVTDSFFKKRNNK